MKKMTQTERMQADQQGVSAVRLLAPEDIQVGDFVAILSVRIDLPSFLWPCRDSLRVDELISLDFTSGGSAVPLKVTSVCLPYVLTRAPDGTPNMLDVRRQRLGRLSNHFARKACKALRVAKAEPAL